MAITKVTRNLLSTGIDDQSNATAITIDSSENVSIGTTTTFSNPLTTNQSGGAAGASRNQIAMTHTGASTAYHLKTIRAAATDEPAGLAFVENTTERMRIQGTGGISFNGDTAAANARDDYEEGTHTATIGCGTSGTVTLNSSFDDLNYIKIGRMVHIQGMLTVSSVSSPSGYFTVSLPFNISSWGGTYSGRGTGTILLSGGTSNNVADYVVLLIQGESSARVYLGDGTNVAADSANNIGGGDDIYVGLTYLAN